MELMKKNAIGKKNVETKWENAKNQIWSMSK